MDSNSISLWKILSVVGALIRIELGRLVRSWRTWTIAAVGGAVGVVYFVL